MQVPTDLPPFTDELAAALDGSGAGRRKLEQEVLANYLPRCRWFGGKARAPRDFRVRDVVPIGPARALFISVQYADGTGETYQLFVTVVRGDAARVLPPEAVLARSAEAALSDALYDDATRQAIFGLMSGEAGSAGAEGEIRGVRGAALEDVAGAESRLLKVEQSNSSVIYGDRIFLKLYRKLEAGINPDAEITRFLSEQQGFPHVPPFAGALEYRLSGSEPQVLGLAQGLVANRGDAWSWALGEVGTFFSRLPEGAPLKSSTSTFEAPSGDDGVLLGAQFLARVGQLGTRTGELHLALAADKEDAAFAPEEFSTADAQALAAAIRASAARLDTGHETLRATLPLVEKRAAAIAGLQFRAAKTRTHGDYHLGQVLETGGDFVIIDFEGEPSRALAERRQKRSPLRDVAGMLRSFHYAAHAALVGRADRAQLEPWAERWSQAASRVFLASWLKTTRGAVFVPETADGVEELLSAFLLEKALYEVAYELNNRPDWLPIPLRGLQRVLGA